MGGISQRYRLTRAAILVLTLLIGLRLILETWNNAQAGGRGKPSDSVQEKRGERSGSRCNPLSIVCVADSAPATERTRQSPEEISPPASKWTRLDPALKAFRSVRQHIVLAGHSRLRQVFEQLQPLLEAPLRTRADPAPPLPDHDHPLAPPMSANSTCLGVRPDRRPPNVWCSYAADWGRTLLDYRWRRLTKRLSALLGALATRPPKWLVVAYGLHQAPLPLLGLRDRLPNLITRLKVLQHQGTRTVWMLEAAKNIYMRSSPDMIFPGDTKLMVMNAITSEMALLAGIPLWSSHLPLVQDWILRECLEHQATDEASRTACEQEQTHVTPKINLLLAHQLLRAMVGTATRENEITHVISEFTNVSSAAYALEVQIR